jgi:hypothetical protein
MNYLEYDFPRIDREAYTRYPKLNWVYDLTRVLDAQNIQWLPFLQEPFYHSEPQFLNTITEVSTDVYLEENTGQVKFTQAIVQRGEVKWLAHWDHFSEQFEDEVVGAVDLRISAFVTMYMQKHSGCVTFESVGSDIRRVWLKPFQPALAQFPPEAEKLFKKVYKKLPTP